MRSNVTICVDVKPGANHRSCLMRLSCCLEVHSMTLQVSSVFILFSTAGTSKKSVEIWRKSLCSLQNYVVACFEFSSKHVGQDGSHPYDTIK